MAAELVLVADAITTELANATFADLGWTFEPERSYADWASDIEELNGLHVDVVPVTYEENELDTEGSVGYLCTVDIGVRLWFTQTERGAKKRVDRAKVDRLILFIQELNEFFCKDRGRSLTEYPTAAWEKTKIRAAYSRKHLAKHKMFLGLIRVSYTVTKDL